MTTEPNDERYVPTEEGEQLARSLLPVGACPTELQVSSLLLAWELWQSGFRSEAWFKERAATIAADCHYEGA